MKNIIEEDAKILLGEEVDFDYFFYNKISRDTRLDFYRKRKDYYGHYGFSDLVYSVVLHLERYENQIPSYELVVVDEFQDFNYLEVSLIDLLAKRSPVLIVGDDDQALYESLKSASAKYNRERHYVKSF